MNNKKQTVGDKLQHNGPLNAVGGAVKPDSIMEDYGMIDFP
jgi:hypothetical protein